MTVTHALTAAIGPTLTDWLDTDDHRDQAFLLFQLVATKDPYNAAAWLIGQNPHLNDGTPPQAIRNGHGADARNAARAYLTD